jgi:delta1-piperideine-2-carboxylate reductase
VETKLSHAELVARISVALVANGFESAVAAPIARSIAACERDGTFSHGLLRLPGYVEAVRTGWADGRALPATVSTADSMIVMDALNGFTHLALAQSRGELAKRALSTGTAILLIRNAHHFAALWPDIEDFAAEGFIALSCVTSRARVTAWGGGKPVFGTNASAFACPRADAPPIVWDQSASVMSQGEILLAAREGRRLPEGVGVDAHGKPTDDPAAVLAGGALLPFGGVKGASIAFAVEILAAALSGSAFGFESPDGGTLPSKGGQFVMLIDPRRAGADVASRVEGLVDAIHAAGSPHLPASRRYARRAATLAEGIPIGARSNEILQRLLEPRKDAP